MLSMMTAAFFSSNLDGIPWAFLFYIVLAASSSDFAPFLFACLGFLCNCESL